MIVLNDSDFFADETSKKSWGPFLGSDSSDVTKIVFDRNNSWWQETTVVIKMRSEGWQNNWGNVRGKARVEK